MNLPGYEEALKLGYGIHMYSSNRKTAMYVKDALDGWCIHLEVVECGDGTFTADLQTIHKLLTISTGLFTFPHPRFEIFEDQILKVINAIRLGG